MRPTHIRPIGFGSSLANIRESQGYSVSSLAEAAGVAPSSVSDLEREKRKITGKMARRLAGPLGVTPNALLIMASWTPELPWHRALPSTEEASRRVSFVVTSSEEPKLKEYLAFLRFEAMTMRHR